jgi:hypothetical protein
LAVHDTGGLSGHRAPSAGFTATEGRKFGFPVGAAFLLLTGVLVWRGHALPAYVTGAAGVFLIVGALAVPSRLGPVYRAWMALALAMSKVTTPIFMGLLYFVVLTPVGAIRRTFGSNPLKRTPTATNYWVSRSAPRGDLRRQF